MGSLTGVLLVVDVIQSAWMSPDSGRTVELVAEILERQDSAAAQRSERLARRLASLDDATFADALCQTLSFSTPEKQGLLEADGVAARLESLIQLLRFRLAELSGGSQLSRTLQ